MPRKIQFKRGTKAKLPTLAAGEPAFTTDEGRLYIGTGTGNIPLARQDELPQTAGVTAYYKIFTAADWSGGKLVLPASTHGIRSSAVTVRVWVLTGGTLVAGTWAGLETAAVIDGAGNITLSYGGAAYAGAVLVMG